jgi:3-dehydroquinate dehydratase-2
MARVVKPKILIASGVNLDLLGKRQPDIYGYDTLKDMEVLVRSQWKKRYSKAKFELVFFQTNDEAKFLKELDKDYIAAVINAGAWTHTSLAIADRLVGLQLPFVEAHVSQVSNREPFRQHSFLKPHAIALVEGHGIKSYWLALEKLMEHVGYEGS